MSQFLKYLEKYEEEGNNVIFHLKNFHTSKLAGNKIVRELFLFLFHDETLRLNRVKKINDLTYFVQKEQEYKCLNCLTPLFFEKDYIMTCESCNWRNEINETPAITPITLKRKKDQICYPLIEESDLDMLPEQLKIAIETYFKKPGEFTKEMYQNIYHNIYRKDVKKLSELAKKYTQKAKLAHFFKDTNFAK
ncbi:MAG: hypothetical protein ACFFDN_29165 [Candidatus Hodarchaeota archaeon]